MESPPVPLTRRGLAALAAVGALALVGCSTETSQDTTTTPTPSGTGRYEPPPSPTAAEPLPSGSAGTPRGGSLPRRGTVDLDDATAVSRAAVTTLWRQDTRLDTSPHDATVRMARAGWCTPRYARELTRHQPRAGGGEQWNTWASHGAYTTVEVEQADEAGRPPDTPNRAYRQWTGRLTPHARSAAGEPQTQTAFVTLTRSSHGWRVSRLDAQQ